MFAARITCCTMISLVAACEIMAAGGDAILARETGELFIRRRELLESLPELVAQLEVPAGLDLGPLVHLGTYVPSPKGEKGVWDFTKLPAERVILRFEFTKGTLKDALDAFCKSNPSIEWQCQDGVVLLVRRKPGGEDLRTLLAQRIKQFAVDKQPLNQALQLLKGAVDKTWTPKAKDWPWKLGFPIQEGKPDDWPRQREDLPVAVSLSDAPLHSILGGLVRQLPGFFWVAYDQDQAEPWEPDRGRQGMVIVNCASTVRRKLDLATLVRCLDKRYTELHGYANIAVRIDDCERELRRRHHFHADAVREALMQSNAMPNLVRTAPLLDMELRLNWFFSLRDRLLTEPMVDLILGLPDRERRYNGIRMLSVSIGYESESTYLPVWKSLVADEDPRVRDLARQMLKWWSPAPG